VYTLAHDKSPDVRSFLVEALKVLQPVLDRLNEEKANELLNYNLSYEINTDTFLSRKVSQQKAEAELKIADNEALGLSGSPPDITPTPVSSKGSFLLD
jgi:hypothetical protein